MKKLILILLAMLLLVGCSNTAAPTPEAPQPDAPNPKGYMSEPQIQLSTEHVYKQESWASENVELKDSSIIMQGKSFFVTIIMEGSIAEDKFKEAVKVEGYSGTPDVTITPSEGKTVFYGCYRDLDMNKPYKLIISKDIVDSEGKTLQADIQKEITLQPDTIAMYTFVSSEGNLAGLGMQNVYDPYAVDNMNITPGAKTFIIDFSAVVDKISVEQSISQNLIDKGVKCSFEWNSARQLTLKLDKLKGGEPAPYSISMMNAKDSNGNPVFGSLYFVTSSANKLGSIDIKDKKDTVIYEFPDKRYLPVQNRKIGSSIIIDDTAAKYVFDMESKQQQTIDINREYTLGIPSLSFKYSYKDSDTVLLLNRADGTIASYSAKDGSSKELFALPIEIVKGNIIEIAVSPDGSKLAVAYEIIPADTMAKHDFAIQVFDMTGKSLYTGNNVFMPRFLELFGAVANMQWQDNETLILEDSISTENKLDYNVISVNISSGEKKILAEHAFKPVLSDNGMLKIESFKDFGSGQRSIDILKEGKKIKSFKAESYQYDNFFFSNENTLIYNEGEKIFAYYIDKGKSQQLGSGYIIGLSQDGSKVYYMTNYRMIYYID